MPITFSAERQSVAQYSLTNSSLATISNSAAAECQAFLKRGNLPTDDPDWLRGYFAGEAEHLRAYMLHEGSALAGIAHFLSRDWSLKCYLGELPIADFPLRRLLLLGPTPRFPDDQAAYDLLFSDLARSSHSCQAVFVADIPIRSYFWDYLQQSEVIRKHFLAYQPEPPSPHLILRFGRSFDEYMAKFSSKHRNSLRREVRKIREGSLGEMRFVRFESPQDVPVFLDGAVEVSKKTYQWTLHQRGLRLTDRVRQRLEGRSNG